MNRHEADTAEAIAAELGFDCTVQETADPGVFRVMTFDPFDKPRHFSSLDAFVGRFGTIEEIRDRRAEEAAEFEMDDATAERLADTMLGLSTRLRGHERAPISALPDTPRRVGHALIRCASSTTDERREGALMLALVDLGAFVDDDEARVVETGDAVRASIVEAQADAIVMWTGVRSWRADVGLPAKIGEAEPAVRAAISSQAGYNTVGVPGTFTWVLVTLIAGGVATVAVFVTSTSLVAVAAGVVASAMLLFPVLGRASAAAEANAGNAALEGDTERGRRARRTMSIVWAVPVVVPVVVMIVAVAIIAVAL